MSERGPALTAWRPGVLVESREGTSFADLSVRGHTFLVMVKRGRSLVGFEFELQRHENFDVVDCILVYFDSIDLVSHVERELELSDLTNGRRPKIKPPQAMWGSGHSIMPHASLNSSVIICDG